MPLTLVYFPHLCTPEMARVVVQDDFNRVVQWMESSGLILNQSKYKIKWMLFGSCQNLAKSPDFGIQSYIRKDFRKSTYCKEIYLFRCWIRWEPFLERSRQYVSSKVSRRLGPLSRIRSYLTLEASKQVYTLLLQPLFDNAYAACGEISEGCCKRVTPPKEPRSSNDITQEHLKWHFPCA